MRASIDGVGRVVIPKPIREGLGLRGGETLDVRERDGVIELRVRPVEMRIRETPEGPVIEPVEELPQLTDELVRETLERVRR
jgi:AbrB family looped-hinge helix DNA binding protein